MKTIITNQTIWNIAYPIILGSLAQTLITHYRHGILRARQ